MLPPYKKTPSVLHKGRYSYRGTTLLLIQANVSALLSTNVRQHVISSIAFRSFCSQTRSTLLHSLIYTNHQLSMQCFSSVLLLFFAFGICYIIRFVLRNASTFLIFSHRKQKIHISYSFSVCIRFHCTMPRMKKKKAMHSFTRKDIQ